MARKFLTPIDLGKNEIQNAVAQNLAGAPAAPVKGQFYFNSTDNILYWYNGGAWIPAQDAGGSGFPGYGGAGGTVAETTFGQAKADGVATTVARADHTHGSPVHDNTAHAGINLSALAAPTADISMGGFKLTSVGAPINGNDATNKTYVDNLVAGLAWKESVRVASPAFTNYNTSTLNPVDGVTLVDGDRVLLKSQTATNTNGIWVAHSGAWTRPTDYDSAGDAEGATVFVTEGTTNADTAWVNTTDGPITIGTTATTWAQFAGGGAVTAGAGMTQAGNVLNVVAGDTSLTVAADSVIVNTAVIATVASLSNFPTTSRSVIAGAGLTGGGNLAADRTLDVVGDATIVVTADSIGRAALTGDVTAIAGSNLTAIPNDTVTNAKLANMAALTIKGNNSGAVADPVDLTKTQFAAMFAGTLAQTFAAQVGGSTAQVINHNFGHKDIMVSVHRNAAPYDTIECDVERTDANNITLRFAVAPSANEYRCVVIG